MYDLLHLTITNYNDLLCKEYMEQLSKMYFMCV